MKKSGQTQLSFGMIFSVILIIAFVAFAVYGISKFLELSRFAQVESFKNSFQADINELYKSSGGGAKNSLDYSLPNKIKQVCFVNDDSENMYFVPLDSDYKGYLLKNVDMVKTVKSSSNNPKKLCISTSEGEVKIRIEKAPDEILVAIAKPK